MTVRRQCVRRISAQLLGALMLVSIPLEAAEQASADTPSLNKPAPLDLGALHAERRRRQDGGSTQPRGPSRTVIINGEVVTVSEPPQANPPQAGDANHSQAGEEHAPTPPPPPPSAFELTLEWFAAGLNHAATWRDLAEVSRSLQAAYPALASEFNAPGFEEFEYQIAAAFAERMQNLLSLALQKQPRAAFLPLEALPDFVSGRANFMLANLRALLFAHGLKQSTQTPVKPALLAQWLRELAEQAPPALADEDKTVASEELRQNLRQVVTEVIADFSSKPAYMDFAAQRSQNLDAIREAVCLLASRLNLDIPVEVEMNTDRDDAMALALYERELRDLERRPEHGAR